MKKWIPISDVSKTLYLEALFHDYEGFRLLLRGRGDDDRTLRLIFDSHLAYRNVDESERLLMFKKYPVFTEEWTFFELEKSDFIDWLIGESRDILQAEDLTHYVIGTPNDIVEVISLEKPKVEWLN